MSNDRYELIDFGDSRKLESIAGHLIDRPCPAAQHARPHNPTNWNDAEARYDADSRSWAHRTPWPDALDIDCETFRMPVRLTPFGHIGLFPEQADNWRWLGEQAADESRGRLALNLFGYTGASTMALVIAGFAVVHVDAAKPNVRSMRTVAEHNGRPDAPIRYIVDDAARFTAREVRRQRKYHTIVLDPPAYGHSPRGQTWRLERDLWPLLEDCLRMLDPAEFRLLITGHSPTVDHSDVTGFLDRSGFLGRAEGTTGLLIESGRSQLKDQIGRSLDAGFFVRAQSCPTAQ